jgi:hypothetical protein
MSDQTIQSVRDEFSRLRAHLFEACEAAGWPSRQEKGWKGVIRTMTYDSQASIEATLRTATNGGTMGQPGITDAHVQRGRELVYGPVPGHQPSEQPQTPSVATGDVVGVEVGQAADAEPQSTSKKAK